MRRLAFCTLLALHSTAAPAAALLVDTTSDDGSAPFQLCDGDGSNGSLRGAILRANASSGAETITFAIPAADPGYVAATAHWRIAPASSLPPISDDLSIDGYSQPGALPNTLAIADFRNLTGNADDDWIGSGFAESLATDLARLPGVSLIPRDKVRQAGSAGRDTAELGRVLGCRWVLSGAFQRLGPRVRVTAALGDGATGENVFSEKFDGELDELFSLQDRLSARAAEALQSGVAPAPRPAPRIDVFERHARGRRFFHRLEKGTLDHARILFEEAVGADPDYAPALAGLAAVHAMRYPFQTDPKELEISQGYARRAIAADPELAEPRIWLGYALTRLGRHEEAFAQERRAMELDPHSVYAPYFAGFCSSSLGR